MSYSFESHIRDFMYKIDEEQKNLIEFLDHVDTREFINPSQALSAIYEWKEILNELSSVCSLAISKNIDFRKETNQN